MSIRKLEQRCEWPNGLRGEWEPFETDRALSVDSWKTADFARYVRQYNRDAKASGSYTRIRSIEAEDAF